MTSIARVHEQQYRSAGPKATQPFSSFQREIRRHYFITICCQRRGANQLCIDRVANVLFETAQRYHASPRWYLKLLLLMPDHVHMLIGIPSDAKLSNLIRDFKRITNRIAIQFPAPLSWPRMLLLTPLSD